MAKKLVAQIGPVRVYKNGDDRKIDFQNAIVLTDKYVDFYGRTKLRGGIFFDKTNKREALKHIIKWYFKR